MFAKDLERRVLSFWFNNIHDNVPVDPNLLKLWFMGSPATDLEIKSRFGQDIEHVAQNTNGLLDELKATPTGCLTAIVVLDQFTRNVYRNTANMFCHDPLALDLSRKLYSENQDTQLHPILRLFAYFVPTFDHPFEHSENNQDQITSVTLFQRLLEEESSKPASPYSPIIQNFLEYAHSHKKVIDRFGRYPHRNSLLNRTDTPEEDEYLKNGGQRF